jgi:excisionase family DNA binding protein
MPTQLLTAPQLAERLNVGPQCIQRLAKAGRIPEIVLASHIRRFDFDAVMEALKCPGKAKASKG